MEGMNRKELKSEDKLPFIFGLANSFGGSQGTVREALKRLQVLRTVRIEDGRGIFVAKAGALQEYMRP